ncbi:hypothetical protein A2U01_0015228 [Trifolium medium]|uniref:Uncharacterized protein n=1 Tax=Trifolium medium TaxID=97028 RepID=A0A392N3H6_9FABA|nr:hypothetical protein [Trifolium medium]
MEKEERVRRRFEKNEEDLGGGRNSTADLKSGGFAGGRKNGDVRSGGGVEGAIGTLSGGFGGGRGGGGIGGVKILTGSDLRSGGSGGGRIRVGSRSPAALKFTTALWRQRTSGGY